MALQAAKVKNGEAPSASGSALQVPGLVDRLLDYPRRFQQFLREVRVEMRQVTWPTREDVFATTVVVLVTVAFFAFYFFVVDSAAGFLVQRVFNLFKR